MAFSIILKLRLTCNVKESGFFLKLSTKRIENTIIIILYEYIIIKKYFCGLSYLVSQVSGAVGEIVQIFNF